MSKSSHTIGSVLHRLGVAGPVRSRTFQRISALIAVLGSLVFAAAPAQAAIAHKYLSQLTGAPAGSFSDGACGVTVDPATQDVYVVNPGNNAIDIFEPSGAGAYTYKSQISGLNIPGGSFDAQYICNVAVSDVTGDVYLASEDPSAEENHQKVVYVFNASGTYIETMNGLGTPIGSLGNGSSDESVVVDQANGDVYVATSYMNEIDVFNSANKYVFRFSGPEWLAAVSSGDIYGWERGGTIYKFTSSGSLMAEINTHGGQIGSGITVDPAGNVYVTNNGIVEEYGPSGELEGQTRAAPGGSLASAAANSSENLIVADDDSPSVVDVFGPGIVVPGTTVQAPSSVGSTTAVANGSVNPSGVQVTSCEFEYGASTSYGQSEPCEQKPAEIGSGTSPVPVTATLKGLQPNTVYYYRLNAADANGNANEAGGSGAETFTTPGIPKVVSESAEIKSTEKAGQTHATLKATINPDGRETAYDFEYGETESYGASTPPGDLGPGEVPVSGTAELSGLKVDTTYHYRVVASNECEVHKTCTAYGLDQTFTTVAAVLVEGLSVSDVAGTSTTLKAQVDPLGTDTNAYFQYGTVSCATSPASCTDVPLSPGVDVGSAEGYQALSIHLQSLTPSTTYYYRVIATNALGTAEGERNVNGKEIVHTFTTQAVGSALTLPDGREWEQVSPPNKHGAYLWGINAFNGVMEAAADGGAITYNANTPTELEPRASHYRVTQVFSTRTSGGWSSQDIDTPNNYEAGVDLSVGFEYRSFSPDLSRALVEPVGAFTPLSKGEVSEEVPPRATEQTEYVRSDFTCQATPATCYTPLVTPANTPPETKIGNQEEEDPEYGSLVKFDGANPDLSHVVLDSSVSLVEGAPSRPFGGTGYEAPLYEWSGGQLQLVSVLPASEGGGDAPSGALGGLTSDSELEARNAISSDGARVVWSDGDDKGLYMRDTVRGETVRIGGAGAEFMDASGDDSKVFFLQEGDLYVFEVTSGTSELLAGNVTRLTKNAKVQKTVLGSSEDGSYVYFVANGVLTGTEENGEHEKALTGQDNLYLEHYDSETSRWTPMFIATLNGSDYLDWYGDELKRHTSRVSPDGRYLAFMSSQSLTGYDNADANAGQPDEEVYLYHAEVSSSGELEPGKLVCASCNPTGARPLGVAPAEGFIDDEFWESARLAADVPGFTGYSNSRALYQSRYLSDSGRLFFNSPEALVPQDVNGTWDVYEYEPPGVGSCTVSSVTFGVRSGGCIGLISSGESAEESAFLDASENGDDAFFLTSARLAPTDIDNDYDVYDAHICGAEGVACATSVEQLPPCTTEASCKSAPTPQPTLYASPASATFNGPGNLAPPPPPALAKVTIKKTVKCKKGSVKNKKGECVRSKSKKKAKKSSANRRAKS